MSKSSKHKGFVRIISGKWRRRRITVADVPGLRPTGDRVRETLFNWIQAYLPGSNCLDLFAGTGALGIEAASRGAAYAVLVERDRTAVNAMEEFVGSLDDPLFEILQVDTLTYLGSNRDQQFDVVFVDPPFDLQLQEQVLGLLAENNWLAPGAIIYVESSVKQSRIAVPMGLARLQDKVIGEVRIQLYRAAD